MPLSLADLVRKIDGYAGSMTGAEPLKRVSSSTEQWLTGQVVETNHADNGNGSVLHPLSFLHSTTGAAPHYTLQAGWIQALCLKKLDLISDSNLVVAANGSKEATTKNAAKGAQELAFGPAISGIGNLHFYPVGGKVEVCDVTLESAMVLVRRVMELAGPIASAANLKDAEFLAGVPITINGLSQYRLKLKETGKWQRLSILLNSVESRSDAFGKERNLRKLRATELLDILTRMSGNEVEDEAV